MSVSVMLPVPARRGLVRGMADVPRKVTSGCPGGYVAPPFDAQSNASLSLRRVVDRPLMASTLVFVVGPEDTERLGARGFARAIYESMCDGLTCMEVTTALFITTEVLNSQTQLEVAMVVGLGIDPTGGRYPDGYPPGGARDTK